MPKAAALIKRISKAIKKVGPMARIAYLRAVVINGADHDELIGRAGTVSNTDTLFNPQPIYRQLGHRQAMYLSGSSLQLVADDYKFTFPVTQVSKSSFEQANTYIVLKDDNGEERFRILYVITDDLGGQDLVISVFVRSIGH